jgi:hypothetical protein
VLDGIKTDSEHWFFFVNIDKENFLVIVENICSTYVLIFLEKKSNLPLEIISYIEMVQCDTCHIEIYSGLVKHLLQWVMFI